MDVVKVTREHQAVVPSRGLAKPAANPTFRLLGHRKAQDGMTWNDHYKQALAKFAAVHQTPDLRPILEQISQDPRYRAEGYTSKQLVDWWMKNPQAAAGAIEDFSRRTGTTAGHDIAQSVADPSTPGNAITRVPGPLAAPVNLAAAALIPWNAQGLAQNAARLAPDAVSAWLSSAPPEMRNETVRRLGGLWNLQNKRHQLQDGTPEALKVDQQIQQAQATVAPITGVAETTSDDIQQVFGNLSQSTLMTALYRSPIGASLPIIGAATHPGAFFNPETRRDATGNVVSGLTGTAIAQQWTPQTIRNWVARQPATIKGLPAAAKNWTARGLTALKNLRAPAAAATTTAVEGAEATAKAAPLFARTIGRLGAVGRGAGVVARALPAVMTGITGAREAWNLPHNLSDEGQQELTQMMIDRDPVRQQQSRLGRVGSGVTDALSGILAGDMTPAKADFALALSEATDNMPDEVLQSRYDLEDRQQQSAMQDQLNSGFQKTFRHLTPNTNYDLARAATARQWASEHGEQIDPNEDEQQVEAWMGEARQAGILARDPTPAEMGRIKLMARVAGADATREALFPETYDENGAPTGQYAAHPYNLTNLSTDAESPSATAPQLEYFHRPIFQPKPAPVAAAPAAPAPLPSRPPAQILPPAPDHEAASKAVDAAIDFSRQHSAQQAAQHMARMDQITQQGQQTARADNDQFVKSIQDQAAAPITPSAFQPMPKPIAPPELPAPVKT